MFYSTVTTSHETPEEKGGGGISNVFLQLFVFVAIFLTPWKPIPASLVQLSSSESDAVIAPHRSGCLLSYARWILPFCLLNLSNMLVDRFYIVSGVVPWPAPSQMCASSCIKVEARAVSASLSLTTMKGATSSASANPRNTSSPMSE